MEVIEMTLPYALWCGALANGLMAGIYFAFSVFIMRALEKIPVAQGINAMNSINAVIVRTLFLPLFFGSTILSGVLVAYGFSVEGTWRSVLVILGGALYVIGMFVVTAARNVPLNNALAAVDAESEAGAAMWRRYLRSWTGWNHVRTVTSAASSGMFVMAGMA